MLSEFRQLRKGRVKDSSAKVDISLVITIGLIVGNCSGTLSCFDACSRRGYFYGELVVNCSFRQFDSIPSVSQFCTPIEIDFSGNELTILSDGELGQFRHLRRVNFSYNHLDYISAAVFNATGATYSNVQEIDFSGNHLNRVPECFQQQSPYTTILQNVTTMYLSKNEIGPTIPEYALAGVQYLEILDLSGNKIQTIEPRTLRYLSHMKYLDLRDNLIESIPSSLFARLAQLETFRLTRNKISDIPSGIPTSLRLLELSENRIKNITPEYAKTLRTFENLESLDLSRNGLVEIAPEAFASMYRLRILDLSYNALHSLQSDVFSQTARLEYLFLNKNPPLNALPNNIFIHLLNLRFLFLYGCSIKTLEIGAPSISPLSPTFSSSITSETVDVDPSYAPKLEAVWLFGNPINCDCQILPLVWFINNRNITLDASPEKFSEDTWMYDPIVEEYLTKDKETYSALSQTSATFCATPFNRHNTVIHKELMKVPESDLICPHQPFFVAVSMFLGITLFAAAIPLVFFSVFLYLCTLRILSKKCGLSLGEDED